MPVAPVKVARSKASETPSRPVTVGSERMLDVLKLLVIRPATEPLLMGTPMEFQFKPPSLL